MAERLRPCQFCGGEERLQLTYDKGHFKGIDTSTPIHEILDNCEVMD